MRRLSKGRAIRDAQMQQQAERADHEKVQAELERHERQIVDLAARLVRLEAEVDIFRPFFIEEKGSK